MRLKSTICHAEERTIHVTWNAMSNTATESLVAHCLNSNSVWLQFRENVSTTASFFLIVSALLQSRSAVPLRGCRGYHRHHHHHHPHYWCLFNRSAPSVVVTTPNKEHDSSLNGMTQLYKDNTEILKRKRRKQTACFAFLLYTCHPEQCSLFQIYIDIYIYKHRYVYRYIYVYFMYVCSEIERDKENKNFTSELESHQVSTIYNLWKEWYTEYKKSSLYEDNHLEKARQTTQNDI